MGVAKIPFDLITDPEPVHIIDYQHSHGVDRQKVSFGYHTISFLLEGRKEIFSLNKNEVILPNQVLLVREGNCLMTETVSQRNNYRSKLISFSKTFLEEFFFKFYSAENLLPSDRQKNQYKVLPFDDFISNYLNSIDLSGNTSTMHKHKAEELLIYLSDKYGFELLAFFQISTINVTVKEVVDQNLLSTLSVEELAFLANMSLSSFKRAFNRTYGSTPHKWIKQKRLELSRQELRQKEIRASDLYLKYGFGSLSAYINSFRQVYGITPKQFQQSLK